MRPSRLSLVAGYLVVVTATVLAVAPLLWMLGKSFGSASEVFGDVLTPVPDQPSGDAYEMAWTSVPFLRYTANSVAAGVVSALVSIVLSVPAGYGFARYRFKASGLMFLSVLTTMMVPVTVLAVPLFLQVSVFGWVNTYAGLVLPMAFWPLGVFVMRQAVLAVPGDFLEAARLDGCGHGRIFLRIMLPLSLPALATTAIFTFIWTWNDFFSQLIFLTKPDMYTVPIALRTFVDATSNSSWGPLFAMSIVSLIPVFLVFLFGQKYLVKGIATTGIK